MVRRRRQVHIFLYCLRGDHFLILDEKTIPFCILVTKHPMFGSFQLDYYLSNRLGLWCEKVLVKGVKGRRRLYF